MLCSAREILIGYDFFFHEPSIDNERKSRTVTIRDGTKYEEVIGVRREWIHPWRSAAMRGGSGFTPPVYYDIAILELGKRVLVLCEFHY